MHYYAADGVGCSPCPGFGAATLAIAASRSSRRSASRSDGSTTLPPSRWAMPPPFSASRLAPRELDHLFFCNSGSEAVDSALKIALAYRKLAGASTRTRFVSRDCSYHGSCFGGTSVGGMAPNGYPWLHLFGPSARRRRRFGRPRSLSRRGLLRAGPRARARLRRCGACAERRAPHRRHPNHRACRRHRPCADRRLAGLARRAPSRPPSSRKIS